MAPTHSKPSPNKTRAPRKLVIPPIGLERPVEKKDYAKGEFVTVKLRNQPNNANSMTYDYQVPFFLLEHLRDGSNSKPDSTV